MSKRMRYILLVLLAPVVLVYTTLTLYKVYEYMFTSAKIANVGKLAVVCAILSVVFTTVMVTMQERGSSEQ